MPNIITSNAVKTMMEAADQAGIRTALGLSTLSTLVPGANVSTALAVAVGTPGAFVVLGGAGGTPTSLTLTNATGLPTAGLVDDSVTLAKIQNASANSKLLGSGAA